MKKFAILLTLIAAFAVAGCGSDEKPASSQLPQAAPAQKVESNDNIQYNEKGERVFKSKKTVKLSEMKGGQVHQFKEK